ncbi:hypothetical protein GWI33_003814 [Rhynchophorus ferrugineus]|uniref:Uncharacterized protein n=1 Tax=Rhynchophorus ferrugineus TaxID=354439 RepID=A0A834HKF3_RHYFE|nr:hypothetical protein GWI33_003814 [Rhynchophorus ferrugineus]
MDGRSPNNLEASARKRSLLFRSHPVPFRSLFFFFFFFFRISTLLVAFAAPVRPPDRVRNRRGIIIGRDTPGVGTIRFRPTGCAALLLFIVETIRLLDLYITETVGGPSGFKYYADPMGKKIGKRCVMQSIQR